jgi:hypothetical protein
MHAVMMMQKQKTTNKYNALFGCRYSTLELNWIGNAKTGQFPSFTPKRQAVISPFARSTCTVENTTHVCITRQEQADYAAIATSSGWIHETGSIDRSKKKDLFTASSASSVLTSCL